MEVLVAGGTGLIGRHVVVELLARGHRVRVLARRPPAPGVLPDGATFVRGDLLEGSLETALSGTQGVVHAAGTDYRVVPRGSAWEFFRRLNVEASARFFAAAAGAGVRRGVFVTSFYHAVDPLLVAEHPYIRSRAESEDAAIQAAGDRLSLAIVQPPFILGRIDGRDSLGAALGRFVRSRAPLLAPPGGSNFLAASSLAHAIAAALDRGQGGARYLVGDENMHWTALLERFAAAAGRPRPARTVPAVVVGAGAWGAGLVWRFAGREPGVRPWAWSQLVARDFFYDAADARDRLGHPTGNLDAAIREALECRPVISP